MTMAATSERVKPAVPAASAMHEAVSPKRPPPCPPVARVMTAAAAIMIAVFISFVLGDLRVLKLMGLGLATRIFIDATVVRMVPVPATMELLGNANWWLPSGSTASCLASASRRRQTSCVHRPSYSRRRRRAHWWPPAVRSARSSLYSQLGATAVSSVEQN
jgi:hypothetical protein